MKQVIVGLTTFVVALVSIGASIAARPEIPIAAELAYCSGQPVEPVNGVLSFDDSSCVLNLIIVWPKGIRGAFVDYSTDGGESWQKAPVPFYFPATDEGLQSGVALDVCDYGLATGTYLFRAHGFRSPNEHGGVFSDTFPFAARLSCG